MPARHPDGPRDADAGCRLAIHVADAADAWLTDPLDGQVYARLVAATLAYRAWARPQLPDAATNDPDTAELTDAVDDEPARLADVAGDVVNSLRSRTEQR